MSLEDIFAGAGDVGGSSFADLPRLRQVKLGESWETRHGEYLLTLKRLEAFTAEQSGKDFVTAEFLVNQVLTSGKNALEEGTTVKAMWDLDRKRNGQLTFRGEAEMKRVKSFFKAMFVQAGIAVTDENVGKLMAVTCKAAMEESEHSPVGTQVVCKTYDEPSKSDKAEHKGKTYATEHWSAPPKAA